MKGDMVTAPNNFLIKISAKQKDILCVYSLGLEWVRPVLVMAIFRIIKIVSNPMR